MDERGVVLRAGGKMMSQAGGETEIGVRGLRAVCGAAACLLALIAFGEAAVAQAGDGQATGLGIAPPRLVAISGRAIGVGGGGESLTGFSMPSLAGGLMAARGETNLGRQGVFGFAVDVPGVMDVLALGGQTLPAGGGVLSGFSLPSVSDEDRVVFGAAVNGQADATRVLSAFSGGLAVQVAAPGERVLGVHSAAGFTTFVSSTDGPSATATVRRRHGDFGGIDMTRGDALLDGVPLGEIDGVSSSAGGMTVIRSSTVATGVPVQRVVLVSPEGGLSNVATFAEVIPDAPGGAGSHHDEGGEPGSGGPAERLFGAFLTPVISRSGRAIAFGAGDVESEAGVYLAMRDMHDDAEHGVLRLMALADESLHVPGTEHHFLGFGDFVSIDDGLADPLAGPMVAFVGFGSGAEQQLLVWQNNVLATAAFAGQVVDGRTIATLHLGSEALSGGRLAFAADFTDGSSGLLVVTVPGPGGAMVMMLAGACAARRRSRARAVPTDRPGQRTTEFQECPIARDNRGAERVDHADTIWSHP